MKPIGWMRRGLLPIGLGFLLLAITLISAVWLSALQASAVSWVTHTLEVQNGINQVRNLVTDVETSHRGFLLTRQESFLDPYNNAVRELPAEIAALRELTRDNPVAQANIARLRPVLERRVQLSTESIELVRSNQMLEAIQRMRAGKGRIAMETVRGILHDMGKSEARLLTERADRANWLTLVARLLLIGSVVLTMIVGVIVVIDWQERLRTLQQKNLELAEEARQRTQAQSLVRQLQKMEAVGQLTGGIAHDFNNMLAIVIGSLDMARRRLTGSEHERVIKCIDNAAEGAERAAALTARLLAFSRQQPLEPKVLEANKLVSGMSELLRRTLGERVQVETVLAGGLWRVFADQAQVESAIVNLAVNARDAMPDGGRLTIESANTELDDRYADAHEEVTAGQYVMLSVTDTGVGMTAEVIERAFEPFFTTKGVGKGTGLGLSQVFGFVKQSNGHVKIYSELDRGTTIKLYLPRYTGDLDIAPATAETALPLPLGRAEEIILVVEDEAKVRHMSADALRELGYSVLQVENGAKALDLMALQPRIDLLFTDIIMPGMTGRELADQARALYPTLKVLYTTGYTRNAIVHNGMVDYGVAFLAKPFSVAALARKIREVIDQA